MTITLYSQTSGSDEWTFEAECTVAECFPDDPHSVAEAIAALERDGVFIVGGGAQPLFKLVMS